MQADIALAATHERSTIAEPVEVRRRLRAALGPWPPPAPLDPVVLCREDGGAYWRELVEYCVEPGERIRAYLLIPKTLRGPVPAVFCHHQNNNEYALGKSEVAGLRGDPEQAYGHELASLGYVCLVPDALGFEDRALPGWDGLRQHIFHLGARLIQGQTLLAKQLSDIQRGIDLLQTRTEVDSESIGILGHSFGGGQAIFASALDPRLKVTVDNCGTTSLNIKVEQAIFIGVDHIVPGLLRAGDIGDFIGSIAPRPFLLSSGSRDQYSTGHADLFARARQYYVEAGVEHRIAHLIFDHGHTFAPEMRHAAYEWMRRWLLPEHEDTPAEHQQ
ncbi:MAG: dienelactone hydrolase family protein [Dehalococcoidia bacterium]